MTFPVHVYLLAWQYLWYGYHTAIADDDVSLRRIDTSFAANARDEQTFALCDEQCIVAFQRLHVGIEELGGVGRSLDFLLVAPGPVDVAVRVVGIDIDIIHRRDAVGDVG